MATLSTWCAAGEPVGTVAPLALAAACDTALVVDLDPSGPAYPGRGSLAQLVEDGPRLSDLQPRSKGIAVLRNGGVGVEDSADVVAALSSNWPNLVVRAPAAAPSEAYPTVPVVPLLPGLSVSTGVAAVYQQMGWLLPAPGPGLLVPTPPRGVVRALLEGRTPRPSRWSRAWAKAWGMPWA